MKPKNLFSRNPFLPLWLMLGLLGPVLAVQAATYSFQGLGTGTAGRYWSVPSNWNGGGILPSFTNAPGDDLQFVIVGSSAYKAFPSGPPVTGWPSNSYWANSITITCNGWNFNHNTASDKIILGAGGLQCNPNNIPNPTTPGPVSFYTPIVLGASCTIYSGDLTNTISFRTDNSGDAGNYGLGQTNDLDLQGFTLTLDGPGAIKFVAPLQTGSIYVGGPIRGSGNIIKKGTGITSFNATNLYTGSTLVLTGLLTVSPICLGGGSYTVGDSGKLGVLTSLGNSVYVNNQTLQISTLSITNSDNPTYTNIQFNVTPTGNPTVPMVHAAHLILNGTCNLQFSGSGLNVGVIDLIQYDNPIEGGGTFNLASLPSGVTANLVMNTGAKKVQLNITEVPNLLWKGQTNGVVIGRWDINTLTNWLDTSANLPAVFNNGFSVRFDDTAATKNVFISNTVAPYLMTVSNALTYTFTNNGTYSNLISGTAKVLKDGVGTMVLGMSNVYSGFTYIKQGTIQCAANYAIGVSSSGFMTNNGTFDLNGTIENFGGLWGSGLVTNSSPNPADLVLQGTAGDSGTFTGRIDQGANGAIKLHKETGYLTLSGNNNYSGGTIYEANGSGSTRWIIVGNNSALGSGAVTIQVTGTLTADSTPRTIANSIDDQVSFQFGNAGAGTLTCSGPITFDDQYGASAVDVPTLTFSNNVVWTGPITSPGSGWSTKEGPGTLRLQNNTCSLVQLNADFQINNGSVILDNEAMSVVGATTPLVRVQSQYTNGLASLYLTNGASLTIGNVNGYYRLRLGDTSSPPGSTNIADIHCQFIADGVTMGYCNTNGGGGAFDQLNLQPGSTNTFTQISAPTNCSANTEINLNGCIIQIPDSGSSAFLQGMTNVFIRSGGVTINGANTNSIHIRQNLLNGGGGGGLTWNGTNDGSGFGIAGYAEAVPAPQSTMLQLDGVNTYTGTTAINVGTLGGTGVLAGPLVLASGTSLSPAGSSSASGGNLGTFTVNSDATLNAGASASFEINNTNTLVTGSPITNDMLVVSGTINVSGATLNVLNRGETNVLGDYFKLFNKAVSFGTVNLPGLTAGLSWQNNLAGDGSIKVVNVVIGPVGFPNNAIAQLPNGNFSISATGAIGTSWSLHATNVLSDDGAANWPVIQSGTISSSPFSVTDNKGTNHARQFYRLSSP